MISDKTAYQKSLIASGIEARTVGYVYFVWEIRIENGCYA